MMPLIARYPDFYAASPQFVALQDAMEPDVLAAWQARDGLVDQLCVDTATWGLQYWEQALGISVEVEKTTAYRRSRIRSKLRGAEVTTVALIKSVASGYFQGDIAVLESPSSYQFQIQFIGTFRDFGEIEDLNKTLREIVPAHLAWDYLVLHDTLRTSLKFGTALHLAKEWSGETDTINADDYTILTDEESGSLLDEDGLLLLDRQEA